MYFIFFLINLQFLNTIGPLIFTIASPLMLKCLRNRPLRRKISHTDQEYVLWGQNGRNQRHYCLIMLSNLFNFSVIYKMWVLIELERSILGLLTKCRIWEKMKWVDLYEIFRELYIIVITPALIVTIRKILHEEIPMICSIS